LWLYHGRRICMHLTSLRSLTSLDVSSCGLLSDATFGAVAWNCTSLTALSVARCRLLTDTRHHAVATKCVDLTSLNISGCTVSDDALIAVASHRTGLTFLDVSGCGLLTVRCRHGGGVQVHQSSVGSSQPLQAAH